MPNWGVNDRKQAAKDREENKKAVNANSKAKAKEEAEWKVTDKEEIRALERKKKDEEKKIAEQEKKLENKKLYEEDQAKYVSNKQTNATKLTRAEIQKRQQQLLLKSLAKANQPNKAESSSEEEKHEFDSDGEDEYRYKLKPNVNHIMREQAELDKEQYSEVIDARGIDDAIGQLGDGQTDKHPEKRARAAFQRYQEEQMPILKQENPTFKRSQLLDLLHRNWKKAPENPFNQTHLEYNEKK